jgi:arylsulfatase A-like enzyme
MLRTHDWKLCIYGEDQGELYNLRVDPYETTNLFDDPDDVGIKFEMMVRLAQRMMCHGQMPEELPEERI